MLGSSSARIAEPLTPSYEDILVAAEAAVKQLKEKFNPRAAEIWARCLRELKRQDEEDQNNISSSEVSTDENRLWIGEKLLVLSNKEIAIGSNGTLICEGSYEGRPVVVKRLLQSHHEVALKEIQHLKESDHHQNIVRYYGVERDKDFVYLALERCNCNLDDLIQICCANSSQYELVMNDYHDDYSTRAVTVYREDRLEQLKKVLGDVSLSKANGYPSDLLLKLMRDMVSGLVHLHELGIIHRDLKPQNVLIIKGRSTLCAKLSDMGISQKLPENRSSLSHLFTGCGTSGWKAPERLRHGHGRQTRAMDLFSLGCILFFCITRGRHPFGFDHDERDMNIKNNNVSLFLVEDIPEAFHLISPLLNADPDLRPKAVEVLHHPLLWCPEKRLSFLRDISNHIVNDKNSDLINALESKACAVLGTKWKGKMVQKWNEKVSDKIITEMRPYLRRDFRYDSVRDLVRLIRNMLSHYGQLPKDIQGLVGPLYEEFDDYFTSRFPKLLIETYKVVCTYCKEEECFRKYFKRDI